MEKLTDDLVKEATIIIDEIEAMGGMVSTPNN
jgi:methylmalonyl-CoA mutase N-terminal domain/subunit